MTSHAVVPRLRSMAQAPLTRRVLWIVSAALGLFLAVALLSFNVADPPSHVVAMHNSPPANLCGSVGAAIAYWTYHTLGFGIWVILAGVGSWVVLTFRGSEVTQPAVRALGLLIMALAVSCMHELLFPEFGSLAGAKAGIIAKAIVTQLISYFSGFGAFLVIVAAFAIGLVVAAERIAFALPRLAWGALKGSTRL
ncbi:MAG: DNA translocase FtsK 4TM domain-containing protein, partial [Phycisphaerales bacterium]|nr:DNA translocase FtsK 4TM domain-containing protein [Phycisphaerales bacterium]